MICFSSLRIGAKETHNILHGCRLYWNSTVKSHFFKTQLLTHFLFHTNLTVWIFKCKLQIRVGGWGPDSYSETSQVSSSCLGASYEHAHTCSTRSFFSWREATNHLFLYLFLCCYTACICMPTLYGIIDAIMLHVLKPCTT